MHKHMNEKAEPILTPENPSLPPEGAEDAFKEMYMTGRAMRTDETLQDFNSEREASWPKEWEKLKQERGWGAQSPDAQMNQGGGVVVNEGETPLTVPEGAEEAFKEMYMTGRAVRTDETLQDFNAEREASWPQEWEKLKQERGWGASSPEVLVDHSEQGVSNADTLRKSESFDFVSPEKQELAKQLSEMTQDEYGEWLSQNLLEEYDLYDQLVMRPEYRTTTSKDRGDILASLMGTPKFKLYKQRMDEFDEFWLTLRKLNAAGGVRTVGSGLDWNNFEINSGTVGHSESKGYLTFKEPLKSLDPGRLSVFMEKLKSSGYNGQVKVPSGRASGLVFRFDNIVFHGNTDEDTQKAMAIAEEIFNGELSHTQVGKDGDNAKGEHKSHSELLAEKIIEEREKGGRWNPKPIIPSGEK